MSAREPEFYFSNDPEFSSETSEALANGDALPAVFEWYQHVGLTIHFVASISDKSTSYILQNPIHWAILRGLLHRCSRLMLANTALTHQGVFGEIAKIIDRCIFETAIKARWLALTGSFSRYLESSLKPEATFKKRLLSDISRAGRETPKQTRMLASIERHRWLAGVNWEDVSNSKKLPPIDSMLDQLKIDPLIYIVGQQLGSHAVHAGWPSLLDDYLYVTVAGEFELRDHDVEPHSGQFLAAIIHVLDAAMDVLRCAFELSAAEQLCADIGRLRGNFIAFYLEQYPQSR